MQPFASQTPDEHGEKRVDKDGEKPKTREKENKGCDKRFCIALR
jgi:hypothetical protein